MAYSVSRRTREVGIRMALGAQRSDVVLLVVKKAALLLALGLTGGLIAAWFATRVIQSFLFNVSGHDPVTIVSSKVNTILPLPERTPFSSVALRSSIDPRKVETTYLTAKSADECAAAKFQVPARRS